MAQDRSGQAGRASTVRCGVTEEHPQHRRDVTGRDARPPSRTVGNEVRVDILGCQRRQFALSLPAPAQEVGSAVAPLLDRAGREAAFVAHPGDERVKLCRKRDGPHRRMPPTEELEPRPRDVAEVDRRPRRHARPDRFDEFAQPLGADPARVSRRQCLSNAQQRPRAAALRKHRGADGGVVAQKVLALPRTRTVAMTGSRRLVAEQSVEHVGLRSEEGQPAGACSYVVSTASFARLAAPAASGRHISSATTSPA